MSYQKWEMGDPARVLERRGETCAHCRHLERWSVAGEMVTTCANPHAPEKKRKAAPASRCIEWRHEKADLS